MISNDSKIGTILIIPSVPLMFEYPALMIREGFQITVPLNTLTVHRGWQHVKKYRPVQCTEAGIVVLTL
jgi:hypothetical protein